MGETALNSQNCAHCGMIHLPNSGTCPRIKAVEYYPDGFIKRVEYHSPFGQTQPLTTTLVRGERE